MKKKSKMKNGNCIHTIRTRQHGDFELVIEKVERSPRVNLILKSDGDVYHFRLGSYMSINSSECDGSIDGFRNVVRNLLKAIEENL